MGLFMSSLFLAELDSSEGAFYSLSIAIAISAIRSFQAISQTV